MGMRSVERLKSKQIKGKKVDGLWNVSPLK